MKPFHRKPHTNYEMDATGRLHGSIEIWHTEMSVSMVAHRGTRHHGLMASYNEWHQVPEYLCLAIVSYYII